MRPVYLALLLAACDTSGIILIPDAVAGSDTEVVEGVTEVHDVTDGSVSDVRAGILKIACDDPTIAEDKEHSMYWRSIPDNFVPIQMMHVVVGVYTNTEVVDYITSTPGHLGVNVCVSSAGGYLLVNGYYQ